LSGQRPGLDRDYKDGLDQVMEFLKDAEFSNLAVLTGKKTSSITGTGTIAYAKLNYTSAPLMKSADVLKPVPGVSASDTFTVSVTKGGVTTNVAIDLAEVDGELTLDNINTLINDELETAGFNTRFKRVQTGGDLEEGDPAPDFTLASHDHKQRVTLSSYRGDRPVVLVFGSYT